MLSSRPVAVLWNADATSPFLVAAGSRGLCDLIWVVDTGDEATAGYIRLLRKFGKIVDSHHRTALDLADELRDLGAGGLLALNDPPLRLGAELAQLLGAVFHSPRTAEMLTDKLHQRAALASAGVPSAAYVAIAPGDEPPTAVPLPAVLKPREGASSRDVSMVRTPEDLASGLADAGDQPMLLEEYLRDRDDRPSFRSGVVSVESFMCDGQITHVGVTGRLPSAPPFRETGTYHPADFDWEGERAVLLDLAERTARAIGVRDGFLHTEIKRTPHGPRVVEINGRMGGLIPEMTARAGGSDLVTQAMRLCLGLPVEPLKPLSGVAWTYFGHAPREATEVVAVDGLVELAILPDVLDVRLDRGPGSPLDARSGTVGNVFTVDGRSADHAAMAATVATILERVTIESR